MKNVLPIVLNKSSDKQLVLLQPVNQQKKEEFLFIYLFIFYLEALLSFLQGEN